MRNILVIDDEMNIRIALARELRESNYNIIRAETGLVALNKIEKVHIDMIILDLNMPVMSGFYFLEELAVSHSHIKIIVLSGVINHEVLDKLRQSKCNIVKVLSKPWDSDQLIKILNHELGLG